MKTATYIEIPDRVATALDAPSRLKVRGTVNGAPFRSSYVTMGGERRMVVNRSTREASGASAGETVTVVMELDDAPRVVTAPRELGAAMKKHPAARSTWNRLSYSHRKEYADWINDAKRADTRARRVVKSIEMLNAGKTQR